MYSLTRFISEVSGIASKVGALFSVTCAVLSTWISHLYGGWNASLSVLFVLVVGDYITGVVASTVDGTGLRSKRGAIGIAKKVSIFFLVFVAHELDLALQLYVLRNTVIYFYVTNELISLLENMGRMGVPVPKQIVQIVYVLKGRNK